MNEMKCVALYWDLFRFGFAIQVLVIIGLLLVENTLDWPHAVEGVDVIEFGAVWYIKPIAFLILSIVFWLRFAIVMQNIRCESVAFASKSVDSGSGGDFLGRVGLGGVNWMFAFFALFTAWYAIFDDVLASIESIVTAVIYVILALAAYGKYGKAPG